MGGYASIRKYGCLDGYKSDFAGAAMMEAALATPAAPARGLGRLWGWIRRTILGPGVARQAVARGTTAVQVESGDEESAVEPRGTVVRERVAAPKGTSVFAPIRQGVAEVPPLPRVVRELMLELAE